MSTPTANSKSPAMRFAAPAGMLLLAGIVTAYGFRSRLSEGELPQLVDVQPPVAESVDVSPAAPLAQWRAPSRPRVAAGVDSEVFPDLQTGLAKLHAGIATTPVKAIERDRLIADLDSRHAAEAIDPVWSATLEAGLAQASASQVMAQAAFNPQDVNSECRSKTCRISARFDNAGDARDWADRLLTQMAGTIGQARVAVLPQPDGRFEVRVYGARRS